MAGNDAFTELLAHCDGSNGGTTFTDSSKNGFTLTPTTTTTSTSQSVFGGTSAAFSATSSGISVPDNAVLRAQAAFTVDFRYRCSDVTTSHIPTAKVNRATGFAPFQITVASGAMTAQSSSNNSSFNLMNGSTFGAVSANTWYHVALVWSGTNFHLFKDGALITTVANSTTPMSTTDVLAIGNNSMPSSSSLNGMFIDEYRYSSTARWTAAFTPPQNPYDAPSRPSFTKPMGFYTRRF